MIECNIAVHIPVNSNESGENVNRYFRVAQHPYDVGLRKNDILHLINVAFYTESGKPTENRYSFQAKVVCRYTNIGLMDGKPRCEIIIYVEMADKEQIPAIVEKEIERFGDYRSWQRPIEDR
jgi:hypothetical protein